MRPKAPIKALNSTGDKTIDIQILKVPDNALTAGSNVIDLSGAAEQTPWVTNINAAGYNLSGAGNITGVNVSGGYATTATAAATTTLTVTDKQTQVFTGSTTQNVVLPVVSTLPQTGFAFRIVNNSSGAVTVQSSGANTISTLAGGTSAWFVANALTGTGASVWTAIAGTGSGTVTDVSVVTANGVSGSVATSTTTPAITLTLGAITPTTVNGMTITTNSGTFAVGNAKSASITGSLTFAGTDGTTLTMPGQTANIGYLESPINSQSSDYTCVLLDSGKTILETGASKTITIPANGSVAYPVGTCLSVICTNASGCSIAITTDTMTLANSTSTGTRTLAQNGRATAQKMTSTTWLISGVGLT